MKQLLAENAQIDISGEKVTINIYVNDQGNLELEGIGDVIYSMLGDELILSRFNEEDWKKNG